MLVDKSLIQKAKEKLGDNNAELIARELDLPDYDSKNRKARCPYHREDTASFIYNPKQFNYHCFGCHKNVDLLDVFMEKGNTYVESVEKLLDLADIEHHFGEHNVRTRASYRYPKPVECNDKSQVYEYLSRRKISQQTADYADVRQDEQGNMVFNYYDTNDVLTMVKYRPSHKIDKAKGEIKCWCQKGADTSPLLFNMNRINTSKPLLITEGELDALAAIESGYTNTVSVPLGAGNFHWIEENWDWLEQFDSIIICADNDEPGIKMQKEVIYRLGSWRCKVVNIPHEVSVSSGRTAAVKDLNEILFHCGKEKVIDLIINASDTPVPSVTDLSLVEDKDLDEMDGIYTGFHSLDKELIKLFFGTVTLFTGTPGSGKTSVLYQIICQCLEQNKNVWLFSKELPDYMTRNWLNYIFAGRRNLEHYTTKDGADFYKVTKQAKDNISKFYSGKWFAYNDNEPCDIDSLLKSGEEVVRKYGAKLLVIDNMMCIDTGASAENENLKQTEVMKKIISFAVKYNVHVILVAHPRKMMTGAELGIYDIAGSSNLVNLAHRTIGLTRVSDKQKRGEENPNGKGWIKEPVPYDAMLSVIKDRMLGRMGFQQGLYYDRQDRRLYTNEEEFGYNYKWDKRRYEDVLDYPQDKADEREVFGVIDSA